MWIYGKEQEQMTQSYYKNSSDQTKQKPKSVYEDTYNTIHEWRYTIKSDKDQIIPVRIFPVSDKEVFVEQRGGKTPLFTFIDPTYDIIHPEIRNNSELFFPVERRIDSNTLSQWKFEKKYMITQFDTDSYTRFFIPNTSAPSEMQPNILSSNQEKKIFFTIVPYYEVELPVYEGNNHIQIQYAGYSRNDIITN